MTGSEGVESFESAGDDGVVQATQVIPALEKLQKMVIPVGRTEQPRSDAALGCCIAKPLPTRKVLVHPVERNLASRAEEVSLAHGSSRGPAVLVIGIAYSGLRALRAVSKRSNRIFGRPRCRHSYYWRAA
jgi:hypothetical protein